MSSSQWVSFLYLPLVWLPYLFPSLPPSLPALFSTYAPSASISFFSFASLLFPSPLPLLPSPLINLSPAAFLLLCLSPSLFFPCWLLPSRLYLLLYLLLSLPKPLLLFHLPLSRPFFCSASLPILCPLSFTHFLFSSLFSLGLRLQDYSVD